MAIKTIKEGRMLCRKVRKSTILRINDKMHIFYSPVLREYSVEELQTNEEEDYSRWFTTMITTNQEELARFLKGKEVK